MQRISVFKKNGHSGEVIMFEYALDEVLRRHSHSFHCNSVDLQLLRPWF